MSITPAAERWKNTETEAMKILKEPELYYEHVPENYQIYLRLFVRPPFELASSWSVFRPHVKGNDEPFFVLISTWDISKDHRINFDPIASLPHVSKKALQPSLNNSEGRIPVDCLEKSIKELAELNMMPFHLRSSLDLDSTQKTLEMHEGQLSTTLTWLNSGSSNFSGIDTIFENLVDQITMQLRK